MSNKVVHERPLFVLFDLLKKYDIDILGHRSRIKRSKLINNIFQEMIVTLLIKNGYIIEDMVFGSNKKEYMYNNTVYKYYWGAKVPIGTGAVYYAGKPCGKNVLLTVNDILEKLTWYPLFIVDFSFWDIHVSKEKNRLLTQAVFTLAAIRRYLWDRNLAIVNVNESISKLLPLWLGSNKIQITKEKGSNLISTLNAKCSEIILLDPNASQELSLNEVFRSKIFIVGGIVDKIIPRKGLTSKLLKTYDCAIPRKILLKGKVIGVPHRINKVIEILLSVRYAGNSIIKAIRDSQARIDARWRLYTEIVSLAKKIKKYNMNLQEYVGFFLDNLRLWLNLNYKDIKIVLSRFRNIRNNPYLEEVVKILNENVDQKFRLSSST